MLCVHAPIVIEEIIKKSRFIGFIYPCSTEADARVYLDKLHNEHTSANHIVFAYRIKTVKGIVCRFYDAGEPSGTAGKPVFQYIEGHDLINVLVVIVRYFGGIKLGAGGLTRAYGHTAKRVIETANIVDYIEWVRYKFIIDYRQLQQFEYSLAKFSGQIMDKEFAGQVQLLVRLPKTQCTEFLMLFSGEKV